jgi:hypothetical protein
MEAFVAQRPLPELPPTCMKQKTSTKRHLLVLKAKKYILFIKRIPFIRFHTSDLFQGHAWARTVRIAGLYWFVISVSASVKEQKSKMTIYTMSTVLFVLKTL